MLPVSVTAGTGSVAVPVLPASQKKKKNRTMNRHTKKSTDNQKIKKIPFSRPTITIESKQKKDLAYLLAGIQLNGGEGDNGSIINRFEDMKLKPKLLKGIYSYGLEKPSHIQQRAIRPCVDGRDVIVQAQSGMGKTAALAISILQRLDVSNPQCQAIVLAPTRELAEQICEVFATLGSRMHATVFACVGGTNVKACKAALLKGKQIVIGTTGRLLHMTKDENCDVFLNMDSVKTLALDEADKMLTGEFQRDITDVFELIPEKAQIILMSATMPEHILRLTNRFMRKPLRFLVNNDELTLEGIRQYYLNVEKEDWKLITLSDIYESISKAQGMIFCNSRKKVKDISTKMEQKGHIVSAMSGDLCQSDRGTILKEFRAGESASRMLITSDLLARGIDVQHVNLVINYDFPTKKEEYIHRVGRGGRYGRNGVALTFVTTAELEGIKTLEQFYNTQIMEMPNIKAILDL